ncbi:MAG: SDR family oxidoreductase [Spirochaetia bacterium]|jgi:putative NADH-flavin reductase
MKIAIFGATGGIGRCLVDLALSQDHMVTAAARNPAKVSRSDERLRVVPCDVLDTACVTAAVDGQEAVLCALGTDTKRQTTLYSTGTRNIIMAMEEKGVRRLILVSNFCVLSETPRDIVGKAMLFLGRIYLRNVLPDQRQALEEVRQSHLEWVVVRPLALSNEPAKGTYRVALDGLPPLGRRISRADVAQFMLGQLTSREYLRTIPSISY